MLLEFFVFAPNGDVVPQIIVPTETRDGTGANGNLHGSVPEQGARDGLVRRWESSQPTGDVFIRLPVCVDRILQMYEWY
jgi:hypothetical protein